MDSTLFLILASVACAAASFVFFQFLIKKVIADIQEIKSSAEKIKRTSLIDMILHAFVVKSKLTIVVKLFSAVLFFYLAKAILPETSWVFAVPVGLVGLYFPGFMVKRHIRQKLAKFEEQLVDSLGIVANSVRVGASLLQAIEVLVKNTQPPLSTEFSEVLRQVRLGVSLSEALNEMTQRVPSKPLAFMVMAINATQEYGGNLSEVLMRLASVMREKTRIQGKIEAITSQGRMSGMVVTFMPFVLALILNIMEPNIFGVLFSDFKGQVLLVFAIIMVMIGNAWIKKIVTIDI